MDLAVLGWMEEESEAFGFLAAREDSNGDTVNPSDWEPAFHAISGDLEGRDLVVGLNKLIVLKAIMESFGYEVGTDFVGSALHTPSHPSESLTETAALPGWVSTYLRPAA